MTSKLVPPFVCLVWWSFLLILARCEEDSVTRISVLNPIYVIKTSLANNISTTPEDNNASDTTYSREAYFTDTTESIGNISHITIGKLAFNDNASNDSLFVSTASSAILTEDPQNGISRSRVRPSQTNVSISIPQGPRSSTPSSTLNEDILNSINFLRLMERNCTVAYLEVKDKKELPVIKGKTSDPCIVGFWHRGSFPLWLHQVSGEGLLTTLPRASDEQRNAFTEQLCPCQSVQVSKSCGQKVMDTMLPLILPCFENEEDPSNASDQDAEIVEKVQKAMKDIQLFKEAKLKLRQTEDL